LTKPEPPLNVATPMKKTTPTKSKHHLTEDDLTPFVLDSKGNELKVGDVVCDHRWTDYTIAEIISGDVDQPPILKLVRGATFLFPHELTKIEVIEDNE
jgi:hypothetical protein